MVAVATLAAVFITGKNSAEKAKADKGKAAQPPSPDETDSDRKRLS